MARERMYLFERAYTDYARWIRRFVDGTSRAVRGIWNWFWTGPGATLFEIMLRIAAVGGTFWVAWSYWSYETAHGRQPAGVLLVLVPVSFVLLWGWKAPVHVLARILTGALASTVMLGFALLALIAAFIVFLPYLLVLILLTALSFILFLPMRGSHSLWLLYRRIAYRCPYDDCAYTGIPIHIGCGQQYPDIRPSFYGIFWHTCRGPDGREVKLPTLDLFGRNRLPRLCGGCKRPLVFSSIGELAERPVAIVGGPGVGKTIFLRQLVRRLQHYLDVLPGSRMQLDSADQARDLQADLDQLDRGQLLPKTAGAVMTAIGVAIRIRKRLKCLLYLYDAPGEDFLSMERFGRKQKMQSVAGILLLVDPFTLPGLAGQAAQAGTSSQLQSEPFDRVVEVFIAAVNSLLVSGPNESSAVPLAVVLSKADALTGQWLVPRECLSPDGSPDGGAACSVTCRDLLVRLGAQRATRALENKFVTVRYFACSALGRAPNRGDNSAFEPIGVLAPILWLLKLE